MPMADGFDNIFNEAIRESDAGGTAVEDAPTMPVESATPAEVTAPVIPEHAAPVVAADTVPPVTAPVVPKAEPKAPTIDGMGRYHRPDGTVMTKAEVEAYKATQTPPVEVPVAEVVPEPTAAPVPANVPYIPEGQREGFYEGALRNPAGDLFVPASQVDALERDIMRGRRYDQFREERRSAVVERERTVAEMGVFNDTLVRHFETPQALQALVEAVNTHGVQAVQREIALAMKEGHLAIKEKFGSGAVQPSMSESVGDATALDPHDAQETFAEYWRDQLARPELAGMTPEIKQYVRDSLNVLPLFVTTNEGAFLNETVAEPVWKMAAQMMAQVKKATEASAFNTRQAARGAATPAPPSVATARTTGTNGNATQAKPKDPMIDPKTGKEYADPWQAILKA